MNKETIKFFVPDICVAFIGIIKGMFRALVMKYRRLSEPQINDNKIIIIGTGPSLKTTICESENILKNTACMSVNGFATTPLFEQIKPKYYILADSAYFISRSQMSERIKKVVDELKQSLIRKTKWDITFIFPYKAFGSEMHKSLLQVRGATFQFYNNAGNGIIIPDWKIKYWLWNKGLIAPLCQTVLNTAVSIAISSRVKEIYLVGADTSWLSTYEIDQLDNTLYTKDEHFYGVNKIPLYRNELLKTKQYLYTELSNVEQVLKFYQVLDKYAEYNNVELYNSSAYSWVDTIKRKPL